MSFKCYQYALPRRSDSRELIGRLSEQGVTLCRRQPVTLQRAWLDSFDWRLHAAGFLLFIDTTGVRQRLHLRVRDSGHDVVAIDVTDPPCFASDLPDGVLRRRIAPLLSPRRLLEQASMKSRIERLDMTDDEGKTVARLSLEQHWVEVGEGERRARLRDRVVVTPVRGYDEALQRLRDFFEHELAWERIKAGVLDEALMAQGRRPQDYCPKPDLGFEPSAPVGLCVRDLCAWLFAVIEANEDGVRHDLDIEFLHDYRVAIRRTRVLLKETESMLTAPHFRRFRDDFAWLGTMTSPVRDLDVHLQEFPQYVAWSGEQRAEDLAPLRSLLRVQRGMTRRDLLAALASPRYRNLKSAWRRLLDSDDEGGWLDGDGKMPVAGLAPALVAERHHKVLKRGGRLTADSPDEDFHDLRKQCKRLRYLMEAFGSQLSTEAIRPQIKALKRLQDNLGEYQDLCVHLGEMTRYGEMLAERGQCPEQTTAALTRVIEHMTRRKEAVRREFAAVFDHFADTAKQARLESRRSDAQREAQA